MDVLEILARVEPYREVWFHGGFASAHASLAASFDTDFEGPDVEDWAWYAASGEPGAALWAAFPVAFVLESWRDRIEFPPLVVVEIVPRFSAPVVELSDALAERWPVFGADFDGPTQERPNLMSPLDFINSTI